MIRLELICNIKQLHFVEVRELHPLLSFLFIFHNDIMEHSLDRLQKQYDHFVDLKRANERMQSKKFINLFYSELEKKDVTETGIVRISLEGQAVMYPYSCKDLHQEIVSIFTKYGYKWRQCPSSYHTVIMNLSDKTVTFRSVS